jgi:hypothetical protein
MTTVRSALIMFVRQESVTGPSPPPVPVPVPHSPPVALPGAL